MQSFRRGFTLIEILLVVTIISILTLIMVMGLRNASIRSREAALRENLHAMRLAIIAFQDDVGGYPLTLDQLKLSTQDATTQLPAHDAAGEQMNAANYKGPYVSPDRVPEDPFATDGKWGYRPETGEIYCNSARIAENGTAYKDW